MKGLNNDTAYVKAFQGFLNASAKCGYGISALRFVCNMGREEDKFIESDLDFQVALAKGDISGRELLIMQDVVFGA